MAGHAGLVLLRGVVPALDGLGPRGHPGRAAMTSHGGRDGVVREFW